SVASPCSAPAPWGRPSPPTPPTPACRWTCWTWTARPSRAGWSACWPPARASPRVAERIRRGGFEEDFDRLAEADWIVEAIVERLEPKQELFARVEKAAGPDPGVTSHTSRLRP